MKKLLFTVTVLLSILITSAQTAQLKYIVYDFDGLNIGQTDLPDGDFGSGDLTYSIDGSPLPASDVIGDRVVKLKLNWGSGSGQFGKTLARFLELDPSADRLNFYFYNPTYNSGSAIVKAIINEDDDGNNILDPAQDDKWVFTTTITTSGSWQLVSIPLNSFTDENSGGNGQFDASYTGAAGMIHTVAFSFSKPTPGSTSEQYYLDMITFTEGGMPQGSGPLELPPAGPADNCKLGALGTSASPDQVPSEIHSMLPSTKRISFVNWFVYYSSTGTVANKYPGSEVQSLIDQDVTPIITWEAMYNGYSRLDPVQPRLDNIISGSFDGYIDAFANKIKTYSGTVILRIFHEFEGDWYPWSLTENNKDPQKYINAYRHVVDRFRSLGVNNVKWMWCLNAEPKPYRIHNYVVNCYPGDSYVDIVATDIYNHPNLGTPDWKSFRYTMAESYYYLAKHYSHKPIYVCEVGCRERYTNEPAGSQSKGDWTCVMNRDLKTYFNKVSALVFFSITKEHDWRINSSPAAMGGFESCIWNDSFYYGPVGVKENNQSPGISVYPNPFLNEIRLRSVSAGEGVEISIFDINGKNVFTHSGGEMPSGINTAEIPQGIYILEIRTTKGLQRQKLVKAEK